MIKQINSGRLKRSQKEANKKQWYKDKLNEIDTLSFNEGISTSAFSFNTKRKLKLFYQLYNGKISHYDYKTLCNNFSKTIGDFPADYVLKNIISPKIKSVVGYELKRALGYEILAVNEEATTRKEQLETEMLREYVVNSIVLPIRQELELQAQQQIQGQELDESQIQEINQKIEEELQAKTPEEIKYYMEREHQDPAEILSTHIMKYFEEKLGIKDIFNLGWKHGILSSMEVYRIVDKYGEPHIKVVNPLKFDCEKTLDPTPIEDRQWACEEFYLSYVEFDTIFGKEFTKSELEEVYNSVYNTSSAQHLPRVSDTVVRGEANLDSNISFDFSETGNSDKPIRVLHGEWKALKPIYFLTYQDFETGEILTDLVDESYKLNPEAGDIHIEEEWIMRTYEGYKINSDKYAFLREVDYPIDIDNLNSSKLSYIGDFYDDTNSEATSLIERGVSWEYLYNVLWSRIEKLIASDEGKKLMLNYNLIPKSKGIDIEKWFEYLTLNDIGFLDPTEEGARGADVTNAVKEIDLSLISDINKYIQLAEYVEQRCGEAMGINKQMEGQIKQREAVRNTQQALEQSAIILEPYFDVHSKIQKSVLTSFLERAKLLLKRKQPKYLQYITDDMSKRMLEIDYELLENSTYSIFFSNSGKSYEIKQMMKDLSFAAMQNQTITMADVIKIMNTSSPKEAEERLEAAEKSRLEREERMQQEQSAIQEKIAKQQQDWQLQFEDKKHQNKMEEIALKGEIDIKEQLILSMGFNQDKDLDKDGVPDVLEIAKEGIKANIAAEKAAIEREKIALEGKKHEDKMKLESNKLKHINNKNN